MDDKIHILSISVVGGFGIGYSMCKGITIYDTDYLKLREIQELLFDLQNDSYGKNIHDEDLYEKIRKCGLGIIVDFRLKDEEVWCSTDLRSFEKGTIYSGIY